MLMVIAMLYEMILASYTLSLTSHQVVAATVLSAVCPFFTLAGQHFFVESPSFRSRLILTAATGLGYGLGTIVALHLF